MKVIIGVSNRHIHLCSEDYKVLFGEMAMEKIKDLVQPLEFASNLTVDIETAKSKLTRVRVLGPLRSYTQVEVSKTDCFTLGIDAPVRSSGDLTDAAEVTIVGPCGTIVKSCAIIANRHLHINPQIRASLGLENVEKIKVRIGEEKRAILGDVYIKETPLGELELHLDTDDANGNLIKTGDMATLIY